MNYMILVMGYLLVSAVVLWYFIKTKGYLLSRLVTIAIVIGYGIALMYAVPSLMGWPVKVEAMPDKTQIIIYLVQEPSETKAGYIFFWTAREKQEPRAYKIPYTKCLHREIVKAGEKVPKGGRLVVGRRTSGEKGKKGNKSETDGHKKTMSFRVIHPQMLLKKND